MRVATDATVTINSCLPDNYIEVYNENLRKFAPIVALAGSLGSVIAKRIQFDKLIAAEVARGGFSGGNGAGNGEGAAASVPGVYR